MSLHFSLISFTALNPRGDFNISNLVRFAGTQSLRCNEMRFEMMMQPDHSLGEVVLEPPRFSPDIVRALRRYEEMAGKDGCNKFSRPNPAISCFHAGG